MRVVLLLFLSKCGLTNNVNGGCFREAAEFCRSMRFVQLLSPLRCRSSTMVRFKNQWIIRVSPELNYPSPGLGVSLS